MEGRTVGVPPSVNLTINGAERVFDHEPTIGEVLVQLGIAPSAVAVEVNRTIVPRRLHSRARLNQGDAVEVVTFVGGG